MAKAIRPIVGAAAKTGKKIYVTVSGVHRLAKKIYTIVGGALKQCWSSEFSTLTPDGTATALSYGRSQVKAFGNSEYCIFSGGTQSGSPITESNPYNKSLVRSIIYVLGNTGMTGAFTPNYGFVGGGYPADPDGYVKGVENGLKAVSNTLVVSSLTMSSNRSGFAMGRTTNNLVTFSGARTRYTDDDPAEDFDLFNLSTLVKTNIELTTGRKNPGGGRLGNGKAIFHGGYYTNSDSPYNWAWIIDDNGVVTISYPSISFSYGGMAENAAFNGTYTIFSRSGLSFNSQGVQTTTISAISSAYGSCSVEEGLSVFCISNGYVYVNRNLVAQTVTATGVLSQSAAGTVGEYVLSTYSVGANNPAVYKNKIS